MKDENRVKRQMRFSQHSYYTKFILLQHNMPIGLLQGFSGLYSLARYITEQHCRPISAVTQQESKRSFSTKNGDFDAVIIKTEIPAQIEESVWQGLDTYPACFPNDVLKRSFSVSLLATEWGNGETVPCGRLVLSKSSHFAFLANCSAHKCKCKTVQE